MRYGISAYNEGQEIIKRKNRENNKEYYNIDEEEIEEVSDLPLLLKKTLVVIIILACGFYLIYFVAQFSEQTKSYVPDKSTERMVKNMSVNMQNVVTRSEAKRAVESCSNKESKSYDKLAGDVWTESNRISQGDYMLVELISAKKQGKATVYFEKGKLITFDIRSDNEFKEDLYDLCNILELYEEYYTRWYDEFAKYDKKEESYSTTEGYYEGYINISYNAAYDGFRYHFLIDTL